MLLPIAKRVILLPKLLHPASQNKNTLICKNRLTSQKLLFISTFTIGLSGILLVLSVIASHGFTC